MIRTIEAVIEVNGEIRLLEPVHVSAPQRVLVTFVDDKAESPIAEITLLSEQALAADWNRPEEDAAWSDLKPAT